MTRPIPVAIEFDSVVSLPAVHGIRVVVGAYFGPSL